MKTIDTLIPDIYAVVEGKGGWDETITDFFASSLATIASNRFTKEQEPRAYLSPSMIGTSCDRQLWYKINESDKGEPLGATTLGTFFYGDMLEALLVSLIKSTDHTVEGLQEPLDIYGVKGSGDIIVDGVVLDIKSAGRFSIEKFKQHQLKGYEKTDRQRNKTWVSAEDADPFGYISQLSSYLAGYRDDPRVTEKNKAGFLVVNKERFSLCLDMYDLTEEVANKEAEVNRAKEVVAGDLPTQRLPAVPDGKSGNHKLDVKCSYCDFKHHCWDNLRQFVFASGPVWMTHVVREPDVMEIRR